MSDKTYPYIGKCKANNLTVIFSERMSGTTLDCGESGVSELGKYETGFNEPEFENITREYLAGAKIRIKSPEHSEFVQMLALNHGFKWLGGGVDVTQTDKPFLFFGRGQDGFITWTESEDHYRGKALKEITIPLPPKEELKANLSDVGVYCEQAVNGLKDLAKLTSRTAKTLKESEWPQIGDEVVLHSIGMTTYNKMVRLTYVGDGVGCYVDLTNDMEYTYAKRETVFKKPKTPEEELRDVLLECEEPELNTLEATVLSSWLLENCNITKKPQ